MRISHANRMVYFSIPKTGSESIRHYLDTVSDEEIRKFPDVTRDHPFYSHMRPLEAKAVFDQRGWDFFSFFRFATIRNPWARIASLYKMMQRNKAFRSSRTTFSDWVSALDPDGKPRAGIQEKWYAHGVMRMTDFLSGNDGTLLVDRVFRVEDQLPLLQDEVARRVRGEVLNTPPRHINRAPRSYDWRQMYSDRDRERVAALYASDIRTFGYEFGSG